jgi:hypothetical protein
MDRIETEFVGNVVEVSNFYADGTAGNDDNDGLSAAKPVKTLAGLRNIVPKSISENTVLHLDGVFEDAGPVGFMFDVKEGKNLVIDGGNDLVILDDNGGSNYTADSSSANTIGSSGAGFDIVTDGIEEKMGQWVELLGDGPATGEIRTVQKHTDEIVTTQRNWSEDPDAGVSSVEFRFVRPKTQIKNAQVLLKNIGHGDLWFQGFYIGHESADPGTARLMTKDSPGDVHVSHTIVNSNFPAGSIYVESCGWTQFVDRKMDTTSFTRIESAEGSSCGTSLTALAGFGCYFLTSQLVLAYSLVSVAGISAYKTQAVQCWYGARSLFVYMNCCLTDAVLGGNFYNNTGYSSSKFGGHPTYKNLFGGIRMNCSSLAIGDGVEVADSAYGVSMVARSHLRVYAPTGENTLAGVKAEQNSSISMSAVLGVPKVPTLTSINRAATGSIVATGVVAWVDNTDTFILNDGVNPAVTFEFDDNASVTNGAVLRQVDVSAVTTAAELATAIYDAIVLAASGDAGCTLDMTATDPAGGTVVALVNDTPGAAGNVAITETVGDASFAVIGMRNGGTCDVTIGVNDNEQISTWAGALTSPVASNGNVEGLNMKLVLDLYLDASAAPPVL